MKFAVAIVLLICASIDAAAYQKASDQDYREIADQISIMKAAENKLITENNALRRARGDEAEQRRISEEIARLKTVRKAAAEQAIWRTIRAYDIVSFGGNEPRLPKGPTFLASPEKKKGKKISWLPIFEENGRKELQDANGDPAEFRMVDDTIAGNTASDGISRIFPSAFSSPVELASIIIHEKHHFTQNTTDGEANIKTAAELEVEAYELEQRLLIDGVLGYPPEIADAQEKRLIALLFGEKGKKGQPDIKGKRELARESRIAADRYNGGLPSSGVSHTSLPEDEIRRLVSEAKAQIAIAQRDHDDRLRRTILAMTRRSCANPGSVTQSELNSLTSPHHWDFLNQDALPLDNRKCFEVYFYIGRGGRDADEIRSMSAPTLVPLDPRIPRPVPAQPVAATLFAKTLPALRAFAISACRAPAQASPVFLNLGEAFYKSLSGRDAQNDSDVAYHRNGLTGCSDKLFHLLTVMVRDRTYWKVGNRDWIRDTVASFSGGPGRAPGQSPPLQGDLPPPEQKHPDIVIPKLPWEKNIVDIKKTKHEN